jgi:hypothetical protein
VVLHVDQPFPPDRQQCGHDNRAEKQTYETEGLQAAEDSDQREDERQTRRAPDQRRPDELIADQHDNRAPRAREFDRNGRESECMSAIAEAKQFTQ